MLLVCHGLLNGNLAAVAKLAEINKGCNSAAAAAAADRICWAANIAVT